MARHTGWWGASVIGMSGWLFCGCAQLPEYAIPKQSLSLDISQPGEARSRAQMSDAPKKAQIAPPQPIEIIPASGVNQPAQQPIQQTSFANRGTVSVQV